MAEKLPALEPDELARMRGSLRASLAPWLGAGALIVLAIFGGFFGWAATAPIATAVVAEGIVKVESSRKRVQHLEGGTVREIVVRDGDEVQAGDTLIRLDDTRARASLAIVQASHDAELARLTRLRSEQADSQTLVFPPELAAREDDPAVAELMDVQRLLFDARRDALVGAVEILTSQIEQLQDKRRGIQAQSAAYREQSALIAEEVSSLRQLVDPGFVDKPRLLALEREAARLAGEQGELTSELAETTTAVGEKRQEIAQVKLDFNQGVIDEVRDAQNRLLDVRERLEAARYVMDNIDIRAPVSGAVVSLSVFSPGEVIQPGATLMEIVPSEARLTVEAKVRLVDVDNLAIGQTADVRFVAFDTRDTPVLEGQVAYISADALEDERTGAGFFQVRVEISPDQAKRLSGKTLLPGMPTDVIIKIGERTVLGYLVQPLSNALAKAWTEQ